MLIAASVTAAALLISYLFDSGKTKMGVRKGMKMFLNILPMFLNTLIIVSIFLYLVPQELLIKWMGSGSGWTGIAIAGALGSVSLIPGIIAYPLCGILYKNGVSYEVIAVFITTLMMVGVLTLPLEAKYFGLRTSIVRNMLSLAGALVIGLIVGAAL